MVSLVYDSKIVLNQTHDNIELGFVFFLYHFKECYFGNNVPVGFSTYATLTQQCPYGDVIRFHVISSYNCNRYNTDTYRFTCPYNGLYPFNVHIVAYHNH